jgi:protein SCO1/2
MWTAIAAATLIAVHALPAHSAGGISLVDQRGTPFSFESLRGSQIVLTFVSAHCTDACPIIEAQIQQAAATLGNSPRSLRFLTVTLDPERDTPLDMRRIATTFGANPARWIVASGSARDVHTLMKRFDVRTERDVHGYATAHTTYVYILDARLNLKRTLLISGNFVSQLLQETSER